ncbi:hypothetical protein [Rhizobium laguerreae]|uniref:hypothetical protein n=1 Tax=Rhizobium laguerreae TaxID=1076926 RepID=UPI001FE3105F|nr:hypothetical protein [Rhizobium laguerreae]
MNKPPEPSAASLTTLARIDDNLIQLLPLLSLLEEPEGPDRIAQLLELLGLILETQNQQAAALQRLAEKLDRLPRR